MAAKGKPLPRKLSRQVQRCPRCGHRADLSAACGRCLCPRCLVRARKWVDMAVERKGR